MSGILLWHLRTLIVLSISSNTETDAWGDTPICPGPGLGASNGSSDSVWGLWGPEEVSGEAASYGGELKTKVDHQTDWSARKGQTELGKPDPRRVEQRVGEIVWAPQRTQGTLQAPHVQTGLKLPTQCGHSLRSSWSSFFHFPFCAMLLCSPVLQIWFPSTSLLWCHEK